MWRGGWGGWGGWPWGGWGWGGGYWSPWGPGNLGYWGQARTRNMMYNPYFANSQMFPYKAPTYFTTKANKKNSGRRKRRSVMPRGPWKYRYSFKPLESERPASYFPYYPGWSLSPHYSYAKAAYLNSLRKKFNNRKIDFMPEQYGSGDPWEESSDYGSSSYGGYGSSSGYGSSGKYGSSGSYGSSSGYGSSGKYNSGSTGEYSPGSYNGYSDW